MGQPVLPAPDSPSRTSRRRHRIVVSLLAVLVFVGLVPLGTVAWKLIDSNREALATAQQEYQLLLASSVANHVDAQVDGLQTQLVRVAQALGAGITRRRDDRDEIRRILEDVVDERFVFLRFTDLRNRNIDSRPVESMPDAVAELFDKGLERAAESMADAPRGRPEAARMSAPQLIEVPEPRPVVVGSVPVVSGGTFRGVLSALIDFQAVWDAVLEGGRTGQAIFALDADGRPFASNDPAIIPGGAALHTDLVRRFLSSEVRAAETLPFVLQQDGRELRYLGSYHVTRMGWGIFVQAREDQVYHPVRAMVESTSLWALVAVGLAILAAVFFAGTLSNPINRLAAASRKFAAGDFSTRVDVRSNNEIGELAETFNGMASEIERQIRQLRRAAAENNALFLGTIKALAQAIDAKDPYTRGHSVRVNKYSVILARQLDLPKREIRDIHVSSLLHDVGKIGVDEAILRKPGHLTDDEFEAIKAHPVLGANIMAPIPQMKNILPGLRSHHERWNGSGYPDGLAGEQIPFMARIIAVADSFDAMTTNRPYQETYSFARAAARINELKGQGYDPRIVEAFNRAYQAGEFGDEVSTGEVAEIAL